MNVRATAVYVYGASNPESKSITNLNVIYSDAGKHTQCRGRSSETTASSIIKLAWDGHAKGDGWWT